MISSAFPDFGTLADIIQNSADGILAYDLEYRYTLWNPVMERISGLPASDVLGGIAHEVFPFLESSGELFYFDEALAGRNAQSTDRPYKIGSTGREGFYSARYFPIFDAAQKVVGGYAIIRDLTGLRESEAAKLHAEARFKAFFDQAPVAMQVFSVEGDVLYANEAWRKLYETSFEELKGYNCLQDPQLRKLGITPQIERVVAGESIHFPPHRYDPPKSGKLGVSKWVDVYMYPIRDQRGVVRELAMTALDITENVAFESKRAQNDRRNRVLARVGATLSSSFEPGTTIPNITRAICQELGDWCFVHQVDANGFQHFEVASSFDDQNDMLMSIGQNLMDPTRGATTSVVFRTGRPWLRPTVRPEDYSKIAKDERELAFIESQAPQSVMAVPITFAGTKYGVITLASTCLDRIYTNEDLSLLEEVGRRVGLSLRNRDLYRSLQVAIEARNEFLSICGHEMRTPLAGLKLQAQIAKHAIEQKDPAIYQAAQIENFVEQTEQQVDRLSVLVEEMLDVTRIVNGRFTVHPFSCDLVEVARNAVSAVALPVTFVAAPECIEGVWDEFRVEQVVANLLTNARKYGAGQPVAVRVWEDGSSAYLSVQDRGIGIDPKDQRRIFEQYERAIPHENISGMGLGLFISREIMRLHGGEIRLESELGRGSTFTIVLPKAIST